VSATARPIAIIGGSGQIARALFAEARAQGLDPVVLARPRIDLERPETLRPALVAVRPRVVINAAGWTTVDEAESAQARAHAVNAESPAEIARWCADAGAHMVHVSSDYVFDGLASRPYPPDHPVCPINAYGRSKAAGEALIRTHLDRHLIVRTSWIYDAAGTNFLTTMLRLAGERDDVTVVADQTAAPTYAADLAGGLLRMAMTALAGSDRAHCGTFHLANSGATTWYGFAEAIFEEWAARGHKRPRLHATTSQNWPAAARRPRYSLLDTSATTAAFGVTLADWRDGLSRCFAARDRA